jgi:hypothetical protein
MSAAASPSQLPTSELNSLHALSLLCPLVFLDFVEMRAP